MAISAGQTKFTHREYAKWKPSWSTALDVYEGAGGFLDPERPYLVPHPREFLDHSIKLEDGSTAPNPNPRQPSPKLKMRRRLARYENVAEIIVQAPMGALFQQAPDRVFGREKTNKDLLAFWANCDGKGTAIDTAMQDAWLVAAVFGHAILLLDKPETEGATAAETGLPRLCRYTPLDLIDWLVDDYGELTAVKLVEPVARTSFESNPNVELLQVRIVDAEKWALYDAKGKKTSEGEHGFGRLPVQILYGKRRPLTPIIGKAVMGDPQLYVDLYNLVSEVRELLRNQTFAVLNLPIGTTGDLQREQELIGRQSGTSNVLFSTNPAQYLSPQGDNVSAYHEHIDRLSRMIYRLAAVPWESDSRVAEAAESRRIKREEQTNVLQKYARELQHVDRQIVDLVYRAKMGPDQAEKRQAEDGVQVSYPTEFSPPDLESVAKEAAKAVSLELGSLATKELKKRTVRAFLPNLETKQLREIDDEIDAQEILTTAERQQSLLEATALRLPAAGTSQEPPAPKPAAA